MPPETWDARAAELPPRDVAICVVAESQDAAGRVASALVERGFAGAAPADPALLATRGESGPSRAVLWRPSPALVRAAPHLPARGRGLDVACGSGRHGAWLACKGIAAWGIDVLPDALARARGLAARAPVTAPVAFAVADATRPLPFADGTFDVVCGFRYLDRALFARLHALLAPGGVLVWETFLVAQAQFGRPTDPRHLLAPGELERLVRDAGLAPLATHESVPPGGPALASVVAVRAA